MQKGRWYPFSQQPNQMYNAISIVEASFGDRWLVGSVSPLFGSFFQIIIYIVLETLYLLEVSTTLDFHSTPKSSSSLAVCITIFFPHLSPSLSLLTRSFGSRPHIHLEYLFISFLTRSIYSFQSFTCPLWFYGLSLLFTDFTANIHMPYIYWIWNTSLRMIFFPSPIYLPANSMISFFKQRSSA